LREIKGIGPSFSKTAQTGRAFLLIGESAATGYQSWRTDLRYFAAGGLTADLPSQPASADKSAGR
jgi:hypothetical protein